MLANGAHKRLRAGREASVFVKQWQIVSVVGWMTGALLSFSAMAIAIRALADALSVFEILLFRSFSGVIVLGALALVRPELRRGLATRRMRLHMFRNTVHFGAQIAWAMSVTLLPLATVFSIEFTAPVWVGLIAVTVLGERATLSRIGAIALGLIGVLVILRPGFENFRPATLLVLGSALGFALAMITTKKLTNTDSTFTILFWMNVIQLPMNFAGSDPAFLAKLAPSMTLPILAVCISGLTSHYCLTNAFRAGDAILVIPLDFLRIPLIAVVGALFYNEPLDAFVFAGGVIIVSGILWNLHSETRNAPLESAQRPGAGCAKRLSGLSRR